jgi:hypothetical protein
MFANVDYLLISICYAHKAMKMAFARSKIRSGPTCDLKAKSMVHFEAALPYQVAAR